MKLIDKLIVWIYDSILRAIPSKRASRWARRKLRNVVEKDYPTSPFYSKSKKSIGKKTNRSLDLISLQLLHPRLQRENIKRP